MRIEATKASGKVLTKEQRESFDSVLGMVNDLAASGHIVVRDSRGQVFKDDVKNPAGRWVGDRVDTGREEAQTEYIDQEGRDRALRIGEPAPNERQDALPTAGNQPHVSTGDDRTADRMDRMEALVGDLLAAVRGNLFGDMNDVGKGWGAPPRTDFDERDRPLRGRMPWGTDDGDPRTERPYNVKTGRPTDQSRDPHTLDMQEGVYQDPPDRVERSLPVAVSPADYGRERVLREVLRELFPKGDFGATNGAPMDSQGIHETVKGALGSLFGGKY